MLTSAIQLQALITDELNRIADRPRRARLQNLLKPPELRSFGWDYGNAGERHQAWVVGQMPDGRVALVYAEEGFGPDFPWGFVFPADDSLGMDAQWHSGLEDAAIGAGILEAPPGYVVPGPRH